MRVFAVAALCLLACAAIGEPQLTAVRCDKPPKLNADPTDPAWQNAPVATPFLDQFTNRPAADQTQARLVYDDQAIYVLFYCHDSQPNRITAREIQPESVFNGEDTVTFQIDPFNTRNGSSLSRFTVNAINTVSESIAGGHSSKAEWRGLWKSFVRRVPDGYLVEMRIPWKILNYTKAAKAQSMDVDFDRYQARTKTHSQWANVTPNFRPEFLGIWTGVLPPGTDTRRRTQFLAYDAPTWDSGRFSNHLGLDVRHAFTNQLTGLLSIRPDFVNIEQQIAGISFVHTERFLDDARPFFTEGGGFYNPVGDYEYGIPFYSQRVGQIDVGGKFYGQIDSKTQIGVLAAKESDGTIATFGNFTRNYSPTFYQNFYGAFFSGDGIQDNQVATKIGNRWGNWFFNGNAALEDNGKGKETAGDFEVGFQDGKLFSILQQEWVDPSFNPPLAYIPWQNRRGFYGYNDYGNTIPKGPIHDYDISLYMPDFYSSDGRPQERGYSLGGHLTTRNDRGISFVRNVVDYAKGSDDTYDIGYAFNTSNRFKKLSVDYLFGRQNGERAQYIDLKGSLRVLKKMDLSLEQSVLLFPGEDARQTIATVGWELDPLRSITARFVQTNGDGNFFLSFRNSGGSGMETYVILGDPNALTFQKKLSLKFVFAF
ncbi:MAG TPA: sugar-binding protein [Fimbriimonas sp.]|nr:sugar-binding protein [Fimbriimonas sp.]